MLDRISLCADVPTRRQSNMTNTYHNVYNLHAFGYVPMRRHADRPNAVCNIHVSYNMLTCRHAAEENVEPGLCFMRIGGCKGGCRATKRP